MSDVRREGSSQIKLPAPGEDATPFLVKCYVKTGSFRPLRDFDLQPVQDEFKLYIWRSATLRDIAGLLHMRDSALSTPTTLHTFRIVSFDERKNIWASREAGRGVTRLSRAAFDDILDDVLSKDEIDSSDQLFRQTVEKVRPQMPAEADDEASRITLDQLHFTEGDILDVAIVKSSLGAADRLDPYPRHYTARKSDR